MDNGRGDPNRMSRLCFRWQVIFNGIVISRSRNNQLLPDVVFPDGFLVEINGYAFGRSQVNSFLKVLLSLDMGRESTTQHSQMPNTG